MQILLGSGNHGACEKILKSPGLTDKHRLFLYPPSTSIDEDNEKTLPSHDRTLTEYIVCSIGLKI